MSYQWSHCSRTYQTRLYYEFECNGYPFFVLDTRTQRFIDDVIGSLEDNHLLGRPTIGEEEPGQLDRLLRWLVAQQAKRGDVPKFVVTSSVLDRKRTRLNSSHSCASRMPSSALKKNKT